MKSGDQINPKERTSNEVGKYEEGKAQLKNLVSGSGREAGGNGSGRRGCGEKVALR